MHRTKKFAIWWLHETRKLAMECGLFATQDEAEAAFPGIAAELLAEPTFDADHIASIRAGSFYLEWPEDEDGKLGRTKTLDWPG